MRALRNGALVGASAVVVALASLVGVSFVPGVPSGVRVAGEPLDESPLRAQLDRRAEAWGERAVRIDVDGRLRRRSRAELGARVDVRSMERAVARLGHSHDPFTDAPALVSAWSGHTDLPWEVEVDSGPVRELVRELAHEIDRPPRGPRFDGRGRLLELSTDGARLDRVGAVAAIVGALREQHVSVVLPVEVLSSGVGDAAVGPRAPRVARPRVLARYSTDYRPRERARSHNLATAAGYLDGARIPAHGRLSFNDRVGPRSYERGYRDAHVILDGEMVDGIGGGVCQIASTLHAAAFLGGFDFVEHAPHSRPSAYIPMGLDATVVWPSVDLVIANPYPFEVRVRAWARDGQVVVELLGARRMRTVDWRRTTVDTEPWSDRYVEDETVPEGEERVTQGGILGYTILRERTIEDANGVHLEERRIRYPPTDRIIRVAPGDGRVLPDNPY